MPPKQGQPPPPPPPPARDDEEECVSNKEVRAMMKVMTELFTKNQQSTDTTLEWVERTIARIIDWVDALETGLPLKDQDKLPDETHEDNYDEEEEVEDEEPFNPPRPPPRWQHTAMTNRCTKSFHTLRIDQIGRVWLVTLIVVLINNMLAVMMILLLKLSLQFLLFMVCMMLKLI
jgi:hypothetical protein